MGIRIVHVGKCFVCNGETEPYYRIHESCFLQYSGLKMPDTREFNWETWNDFVGEEYAIEEWYIYHHPHGGYGCYHKNDLVHSISGHEKMLQWMFDYIKQHS